MLDDHYVDQYQEHLQDSAFVDTWQAAEAAQFLKDEARSAEYDLEELKREALEEFREHYPSFDPNPEPSGLQVALTRLFKQDGLLA